MKKILLLGVAAFTLAACGGGSSYTPTISSPSDPAPSEPAPEVQLTIDQNANVIQNDENLQETLIGHLGHLYWILTDGPLDSEVEEAKRILSDAGIVNANEIVDYIAWYSTPSGAPRPEGPSLTFEDGTTITNNGTGIATSSYSLDEIYGNGAYRIVNVEGLEEAHAEGWTGAGVVIAIAESAGSHRDTVSGIAGLVAPNAHRIVPYTGSGFKNASEANADVANLSIGVNHWRGEEIATDQIVHFINDIVSVTDAGDTVYVISAGNDGLSGLITDDGDGVLEYTDINQIDITAFAPLLNEEFEGKTIAVGALKDGVIADYSNRAGHSAEWFIVADGDNPYSTNPDDEGTSYAAPRVSGAAALVIHKFGTSAENTVRIILETADEIGPAAIYGHGRLNVGRALSPVGEVR